MKTELVRPILIESKEGTLHLSGTKLIDSIEPTGKNNLYNSVPQQLILISLDPNEKIEVGDKCLVKWGVNVSGKDLYEISTCSEIGVGGIHYFDEMSMSFGEHEVSEKIKKVIATQDQLSPEYIQQFIEEYNRGEVKDVEVEMEEYFVQSIGDKVKVLRDVFGFNVNDTITIKEFNYKNDNNLIAFEEDDKYQQGFHISHLDMSTEFKPKLTNGFVIIVEKTPILYTEQEVCGEYDGQSRFDNDGEETQSITEKETLSILEKVKNGQLTLQMAKEQLFVLFGVSNCFSIGTKVQITKCINGHEFEIGEIVTIINRENDDNGEVMWLCRSARGKEWYIDEEEGIPLKTFNSSALEHEIKS